MMATCGVHYRPCLHFLPCDVSDMVLLVPLMLKYRERVETKKKWVERGERESDQENKQIRLHRKNPQRSLSMFWLKLRSDDYSHKVAQEDLQCKQKKTACYDWHEPVYLVCSYLYNNAFHISCPGQEK